MPTKEDFVKLNQKTPFVSKYRSEKKTPFFWVILIIVASITLLILSFIVRTGTPVSDDGKESHTAQEQEKKMTGETSVQDRRPVAEKKEALKIAPPLQIPHDMSAKIQVIENLISSGNLIEARKLLYELYDPRLSNLALRAKIEELIGKVNIEIFNSDIPCPQKKLYTVEKGDTLGEIAGKFNTTVEAIQRANRIDRGSHMIFPGQTLCIHQGDWKIIVSKSDFTLRLFDNERLFKAYKVGIGRQDRTPSGEFIISAKQKNPVWFTEGKTIPFGSPENILGTRWIALTPSGSTDKNLRGYGIHGTWEADSIGRATSNGCIRLKNEDVEELFSIIPSKTTVIVED